MSLRNEREARDAMEPASDSEIDRWLEAAEGKRRRQVGRRANWLVLLAGVLIAVIVVDIVLLLVRGCA